MPPIHLTVSAPLIESDVLKFCVDDWYCKDQVLLDASGGPDVPVVVGTVLGKITSSGKYLPINFGASDGSQHAAAVCLVNAVAVSQDLEILALTRGPAIVLGVPNGTGAVGGLVWPAGATDNQKAGAIAELAALNGAILTLDS